MELTECVMFGTAICTSKTQQNNMGDITNPDDPYNQ